MKTPTLAALALTALALTGCSLAGDVTPPPGRSSNIGSVAPRPVAPQVAVAPIGADSFPEAPPSVVQGAAVYAAHCAACHGPTGRGDGDRSAELQAQLSDPIPDFSRPDRLDPRTPGELFQTITMGRLDKLMPPFGNALTDTERWNAIAFLYTLSTSDAEAEQGGAVFAAQCAKCHAAGAPAAEAQAPDFTDQAFMAAQSQAALIAALDGHEPPLETPVGVVDARAVSAFARRLSFSAEESAFAETNDGAPTTGEAGVVHGRVSQGTQDAALPSGLAVFLRGYDDFSQAVTLSTTIASDGAFEFVAVPVAAGRQYMLTVDHAGLAYGSDIFNFEKGFEVNGLALTVYESTTDTAALRIERLHVEVAEAPTGGALTFSQLVLLGNQSDHTIAPPDGIEVLLPRGATAVVVQGLSEGTDFIRSSDGLQLLLPIRPGPSAAQVSFSFQLPDGQTVDFSQRATYPVQVFEVVVPESLTLTGGDLQDRGAQAPQVPGVRAYRGDDLTAGSTIAFRLALPAADAAPGLPKFDPTLVGVGVAILATVAAGGGYLWRRRRLAPAGAGDETQSAVPTDLDLLLQTIADLDDSYAAGAVDEHDYFLRRARLKSQLFALVGAAPAALDH